MTSTSQGSAMSPPSCVPTACRSIRSSTGSALFPGPFRKIVSSLSRLWPELNRSKPRIISRYPHRTRPCSEVISAGAGHERANLTMFLGGTGRRAGQIGGRLGRERHVIRCQSGTWAGGAWCDRAGVHLSQILQSLFYG